MRRRNLQLSGRDSAAPRGLELGQRLAGVGLGLRWAFLEEFCAADALELSFLEISPENYMRRGGYYPAVLEELSARLPIVTHGLTLSLGAIEPPPADYLRELRDQIVRLGAPWHSDHLCFSTAGPLVLHDLLPLKLCQENVERVSDRLRRVQDTLGVPMAFENISYYAEPGRAEMPETEFITRVLDRSQCQLLLDVNNVYVNSENHGFDPREFIAALPLDRVVQLHVAGHTRDLPGIPGEAGLIIDTHGQNVVESVFELLTWTVTRIGPVPVLLERDHDIPPLAELLEEVARVRDAYERGLAEHRHAASARTSDR